MEIEGWVQMMKNWGTSSGEVFLIFWVELVRHKIAARIQIAGGLREMKGFENGKNGKSNRVYKGLIQPSVINADTRYQNPTDQGNFP